jgi:sulfur dioxygenase
MSEVQFLSLTQLANLWSTEPEALHLWDLRSAEDFAACRIAGAERVVLPDLLAYLKQQRQVDRLQVVIADEPEVLAKELGGVDPRLVVLRGDLRDWCRNGWVSVRGESADLSVLHMRGLSGEEQMAGRNRDFILHQLFEHESSTYTYLLGDRRTGEAILIDPVLETVDRDLKLVDELGLKLLYVLDTHVHADHVTGAGLIRERMQVKTAVSERAEVPCCDLRLSDGQQLQIGSLTLTALATPGHTDACMSFLVKTAEGDMMVFTGDTLLIRGTGRTDFQQGSSDRLYASITERLFTLPDDTIVYPGHDYRGQTSSTIGAEKKHNPRVGGGRSLEEFKQIMSELRLAYPKKIHEALPANMKCGLRGDGRVFHPQTVNAIPEITCEDLERTLRDTSAQSVRLIDVRRPEEFTGELGHIRGARLVTLGPELDQWLASADRAEEIVFICRSGGRSGQATLMAKEKGFQFAVNMQGGMIRWNELKFESQKTI